MQSNGYAMTFNGLAFSGMKVILPKLGRQIQADNIQVPR